MKAACYFYKKGSKIGDATYISSQNVPNWTSLIIPVKFSTSDIPDSATIVFTTANDLNYQNNGSKLYVDNLSFDNLITSACFSSSQLLKSCNLAQNFPNPFNPSTTIRYALPNRSKVRIQIFNTLGQVVSELANNEQAAGYQSVIWNANVASGMYFYRIETTDVSNPSNRFMETKKMILMK